MRLIIFLLTIVLLFGCTKYNSSDEYTATAKKVWGDQILLDNGKIVGLIGVEIPQSRDVNYLPDLWNDMQQLLLDKKVQIKTIVKRNPSGYPVLDLVKAYLDGVELNSYLLMNGKAFFNEEYWDIKEKEHFRELEQIAKKNRVGLWKDKDKLKLLLVRSKYWRLAYSPDCKYTKNIPPGDLIEYYTPPPFPPHKGVLVDTSCVEPDPSVWAPEEPSKK